MAIDITLAAQLSYILGITNLVGMVLVFLSCRCMMTRRLGGLLNSSPAYMRFYKYHCWYWWFFFASVAAHAILAITAFGRPF